MFLLKTGNILHACVCVCVCVNMNMYTVSASHPGAFNPAAACNIFHVCVCVCVCVNMDMYTHVRVPSWCFQRSYSLQYIAGVYVCVNMNMSTATA